MLISTITGIDLAADQVVNTTSEVSSASQSLADGSSAQAASLEETSSSLEEITAMTQQNASNAKQANDLMVDTLQIISQANSAMENVTISLGIASTAAGP